MIRRAFVIVTPEPDTRVISGVRSSFEDHYEYSPSIFFVRTSQALLAKDVAERVGLNVAENAPIGIVHKLRTGYWGRASPLLWEWLADSAE